MLDDSKDKHKKRPYVTKVFIRLAKKEIMKIPYSRKTEYIEQIFLVNNKTTFEFLLKECCDFWALDQSNFGFHSESYNYIMPSSVTTLSHYFETLKFRHVVLYLMSFDKELPQIKGEKASKLFESTRIKANNPDADKRKIEILNKEES